MKVRKGTLIKTSCDICHRLLRVDYTDRSSLIKTSLYAPVLHVGNGRHKCKKCFKSGFKDKWKYILHPIKEEPKCKS